MVPAVYFQAQMFFRDETSKGRSQGELYDLVQHAGNIVPRLYLLCTGNHCVRMLIEWVIGAEVHPLNGTCRVQLEPATFAAARHPPSSS